MSSPMTQYQGLYLLYVKSSQSLQRSVSTEKNKAHIPLYIFFDKQLANYDRVPSSLPLSVIIIVITQQHPRKICAKNQRI